MSGAILDPPTTSEGWGSAYGAFRINREAPVCTTDAPFVFQAGFDHLEGTPTALVFCLGGPNGEVVARLDPGPGGSFFVDLATCNILEDVDYLGGSDWPAFYSPLYLVVETDAYPNGEIGAQFAVGCHAPTVSSSWGEIKRVYR